MSRSAVGKSAEEQAADRLLEIQVDHEHGGDVEGRVSDHYGPDSAGNHEAGTERQSRDGRLDRAEQALVVIMSEAEQNRGRGDRRELGPR